MTDDPTGTVGRRCLQYVLDVAIVSVPVLIVGFGTAILVRPHGGLRGIQVFLVLLVIGMFVLNLAGALLVHIWWPHRHAGRTPAMG